MDRKLFQTPKRDRLGVLLRDIEERERARRIERLMRLAGIITVIAGVGVVLAYIAQQFR